MKNKLKRLAFQLKVHCEFKGTVSESEKWVEIKRSKIMVFPSSFEGFGIPPAEALYCGVPCIASDIPILKEVYGERLEYFYENDIEGLSKMIEEMINNSHLSKRKAIEGREYIRNYFSWDKSAEKIEQILTDA